MQVVPQIAIRASRIASGDALPPVREARELTLAGAQELSLLDIDGELSQSTLPDWVASLVAIADVPVRFDGRLHDGAGIERMSRSPFSSVVVDQEAAFNPPLLRWALDLLGARTVVELQLDDGYVFDAPNSYFGNDLPEIMIELVRQGVRRVLLRDVTGQRVPMQQLLTLGDTHPALSITYQGPVDSEETVAEMRMIGPSLEAVLVASDSPLIEQTYS